MVRIESYFRRIVYGRLKNIERLWSAKLIYGFAKKETEAEKMNKLF